MHMLQLLHNQLIESLPNIHKKRLERLLTTVSCLLMGALLTLSALGRKTRGKAKVKNKIKAIDRLLSNRHLYAEQISIYTVTAAKIIGHLTDVDILVDWSPAGNRKNHMLRASIAFDGSSVTIYQEVHPEKLLGNYNVHKSFLKKLAQVIPAHCNVNIITDAGFRTEWFELVQKQGWYFTGRVLGTINYKLDGAQNWELCSSLHATASNIPQYIGHGVLAKERSLKCEIYLYSDKLCRDKSSTNQKLRKKKRRKIKSGKSHKAYKKVYETPWLLVTSKTHKTNNAKKIVKEYSRRMKIEHDFRSTKNHKTGLGLNVNSVNVENPRKLAILLLIASLAMFILWLVGLAAEAKKLHYSFQANTYRHKRVLSLIFLGLQVIEHCLEAIKIEDVFDALLKVQQMEENFI